MVITTISSVDAINIWFEDSQPPTDGRLYIHNRTRIMVVSPQPGRSVPYIMMNNSDHEFLFNPMLDFESPTNASSFMSAVIGGVEPGAGPEVADEIATAAFSVASHGDWRGVYGVSIRVVLETIDANIYTKCPVAKAGIQNPLQRTGSDAQPGSKGIGTSEGCRHWLISRTLISSIGSGVQFDRPLDSEVGQYPVSRSKGTGFTQEATDKTPNANLLPGEIEMIKPKVVVRLQPTDVKPLINQYSNATNLEQRDGFHRLPISRYALVVPLNAPDSDVMLMIQFSEVFSYPANACDWSES
nr:E3 ubiquitin ligase BIG BROTHER-related-like [Ipomoea batatas]